jgi:hypothetical protein
VEDKLGQGVEMKEFFDSALAKSASQFVIAVLAMAAAIWGASEHFATAADLNRVEVGQKAFTYELQIRFNNQAVRDLKGKLADIEDKNTKTSQDLTKKDRLNREIVDIQRETDVLVKQKFEIENKGK